MLYTICVIHTTVEVKAKIASSLSTMTDLPRLPSPAPLEYVIASEEALVVGTFAYARPDVGIATCLTCDCKT